MNRVFPIKLLVPVACVIVGSAGTAGAQSDPPAEEGSRGAVELVLDSSGSMAKEDAGGQARIDAAREALTTLIGELPEGAPVGLRVYGDAQTEEARRRSCDETRLVQPISPLEPDALAGKVDDFDPGGSTPIGIALQDAARDLPDDGEQVVVLVSDGIDTCAPPDPCQVAKDLAARGVDIRIQAIGLKVSGEARKALQCIAAATGGVYRDASDADSLADSLRAATLRALRGYDVVGEPVTGGPTPDQATPISEGQYVDEIRPDEVVWYSLEVEEGTGYAASATVVPPLPRIPTGASAFAGRFNAALFAVDGAPTQSDPGESIASEQTAELSRDLAAGSPVSLLVTTEAVSTGTGEILFAVALENFADPLPNRNYPLELLVDQVGTPPEEEEPEPVEPAEPVEPDPEPEASDESDDGVSMSSAFAVGGVTVLVGLIAGAVAARRRRA